MYVNIKSSVSLNNYKSDFFLINIGIRQGENLSPLMFALFVNDFEEFLISKDCKGVDIYFDEQLDTYFRILVLLYADDTVLISKTAQGLQKSLDYLHSYACVWNLTVNKSKTKIVVFGKRLRNQDYVLHMMEIY